MVDLISMNARNRSDNSRVIRHFWNGPHDISVTVPAYLTGLNETRNYIGSYYVMSKAEVAYEPGINLSSLRIRFSADDRVDLANPYVTPYGMARVGDTTMGRIEVYVGVLDLDNGATQVIDAPIPAFMGRMNEAILRSGVDQVSYMEVNAVDSKVFLRTAMQFKRSDRDQRRRNADDSARKHVANLSAGRQLGWGTRIDISGGERNTVIPPDDGDGDPGGGEYDPNYPGIDPDTGEEY